MIDLENVKNIRELVSRTLNKLENGEISIQYAAIVMKGCDVVNRTFLIEHGRERLNLLAKGIEL